LHAFKFANLKSGTKERYVSIEKNYKICGELIEDRGSQITYSGLGQFAPLAEKVKWDPDFSKRK